MPSDEGVHTEVLDAPAVHRDSPAGDGRPLIEEPIEAAVRAAWSKAFGPPAHPDVSIMDQLVANVPGVERSIQVHYFLLDLNRATDLALPLTVIFDAPTPRTLSAVVRARRWPAFRRPRLMQPGTGEPLYVIPGIGGMGLDMEELLSALRYEGPIYMGQPLGLDGSQPPLTVLDAIVADQLGLLRGIQPHGPYRLLGYSWGGQVAIEMARVLLAEGETVAYLGAIEPELNEADWPLSVWLEYTVRRFGQHLGKMHQMSLTTALRYGVTRTAPLFGRLLRKCGIDRPFGWSPYDHQGLPGIIDRIWRAEVAAGEPTRMQFFEGRLSLFASRKGHAAVVNPSKLWPRYVRDLDLHWIDGDHMEMMRAPNVVAMAAQISAGLAGRG